MPLTSSSRLRASALIVVAALALSGCATASAAPSATKGASVSTLYGKVTVPLNPKRVVALDFPEATALADLGITPVGKPSYIPALPAYQKLFATVPTVTDSSGQPDLEKIAAQKPDLIIGDEFANKKDPALYKQLSAIAPTVMVVWTEAAGSWREEAQSTAEAVGRTAQLATLKSAYLKHANEIKKKYAAVLASNTVDLVSGGSTTSDWFLYGPTSSHGRVLADAGVRFGAAAGQKAGFEEYSPERFDRLGATGIIIVGAADAKAAEPITSSPTFAALPAAKAGHVFTSNYFFSSSYRIANALLDDLAVALKATS